MSDIKIIEGTATSFHDTVRICEMAKQTGEPVGCVIFGKLVVAQPGDSPSALYRASFPDMVTPSR